MIELLLLAADYSRHASRYLQGTGTNSTLLLFVIGFIIAFWILLINWDRLVRTMTQTEQGTRSLFLELCQTHRLTRAERSELQHVARQQKLSDPALLFVDPVHIDSYFEQTNKSPESSNIRARLFGT